jgi:hypothetical protein
MPELREPKDVEIECQDGTTRIYTISKLPARAGMELVTQYPLTAIPHVGEYGKLEGLMLKMLSFVEATLPDGRKQRLTTWELVDNHVPDWEALMRLQREMATYNISFFQNGQALIFCGKLIQRARSSLAPMLTDLLRSLSENNSQPSGN